MQICRPQLNPFPLCPKIMFLFVEGHLKKKIKNFYHCRKITKFPRIRRKHQVTSSLRSLGGSRVAEMEGVAGGGMWAQSVTSQALIQILPLQRNGPWLCMPDLVRFANDKDLLQEQQIGLCLPDATLSAVVCLGYLTEKDSKAMRPGWPHGAAGGALGPTKQVTIILIYHPWSAGYYVHLTYARTLRREGSVART